MPSEQTQNKLVTRLCHFARIELRALKSSIDKQEREKLMNYQLLPNTEINLYEIITGHANAERALELIRLCAPIVYPTKAVKNLSVSSETWQKDMLAIEYGDTNEETHRLQFSALELMFLYAAFEDIKAAVSFLYSDYYRLKVFEVKNWRF